MSKHQVRVTINGREYRGGVEPRKVVKTGSITYYGQPYRAPDEYIGRRVWTRLKGDSFLIEAGR